MTNFATHYKSNIMATGNSWKTRNEHSRSHSDEPRIVKKHKLKSKPQFTIDDLYITPFTQKKEYDKDGHWKYVPVERNMEPTGIHVMDDLLRFLAGGGSSMQTFAEGHGLTTEEVSVLVFILTGMKCMRFRQLYQMRLVDDLLRFTDLGYDQVARRSGLGSPNNMYLALRRDYDMSGSERRRYLRYEGDLDRYKL